MVDWQALEGVGGVATALAVVIAVGFGVQQLRATAQQRRDAAALAFFQAWADPHIMHQLDLVYALPDAAPAEVVERSAADMRDAAYATYVRFELLGLMVYQRMASLDMANEWAGGAVRVAWRKLRPWIEAKRAASSSQRPGEWFQWLAERLAGMPARDETIGAPVAHKDWKP